MPTIIKVGQCMFHGVIQKNTGTVFSDAVAENQSFS